MSTSATRGYTLTVSRYFATFLTMWATQADIDHTWNMPIPVKGNHTVVLPRRIVFTFRTGGDRSRVMQVARYKIANLRKSPIGARLRDEYEMVE
jgi:hypothetical protein